MGISPIWNRFLRNDFAFSKNFLAKAKRVKPRLWNLICRPQRKPQPPSSSLGYPSKKGTHCSDFQKWSNWGRVKTSLFARVEMPFFVHNFIILFWMGSFSYESLLNRILKMVRELVYILHLKIWHYHILCYKSVPWEIFSTERVIQNVFGIRRD